MFTRTVRAVAALVVVALLSGCGVHVDFSPDGKKMLVSGDPNGLVLMNTDGSARQRLPHTSNAAYAIWSPDGQHILYEYEDRGRGLNASKVFLYDLRTKSARALPGHLSAPYTFSNDGRQLVAWDEKKACLVWLDVPSGERLLEVPCPVTPMTGVRLHWLPDRHGFAFIGQRGKEGVDVYTVEAGKVYRISTTGDVVGLGVSPDGRRLLWARQTGHDANAVVTAFAYDLDARRVQKLPLQVRVRDLIRWQLPQDAKANALVEFSPDAQSVVAMVAYYTENEPPWYRYKGVVLPLSGGAAKEVFSTSPRSRRPEALAGIVWSPDSKCMVLLTLSGEKPSPGEESGLRLRVLRPDGTRRLVINL